MKMVIQIEELFHRSVFAFDELNIVDNQQIILLVLLLEHIITIRAHSIHKAADVIIGMHVAHFGIGLVFQQFVADGLHQVGFTQTGAAV